MDLYTDPAGQPILASSLHGLYKWWVCAGEGRSVKLEGLTDTVGLMVGITGKGAWVASTFIPRTLAIRLKIERSRKEKRLEHQVFGFDLRSKINNRTKNV
jgi:hypothetical protein